MKRDRNPMLVNAVLLVLIGLLAACGRGYYGNPCTTSEECESGLCVLFAGDRGVCSRACDVTPCPAGSACTDRGGRRVCVPDSQPVGDGGAPGSADLAMSPCTRNDECAATDYCDRDQAGRGGCQSCAPQGCGDPCKVGGAGRCLDGERLLFCFNGQTRVVDCAWQGKVCGSRSLGSPQCEAAAPICTLSQCTSNGFAYSCSSGSRTINYSYGGPGPNGLRSLVVTYSNGHKVTCVFTSSSHGSCSDDTSARCAF